MVFFYRLLTTNYRLTRLFSTAWTHIRRSPYQSAAAVLVLALTFFVISFVAAILGISETAIRFFESKPQITVFLKDATKETEAREVAEALKKEEKVADVKYISKDEALKIYQKQNAKDPLLLEMVTANILPASIEISTYRVEDLEEYAKRFKNDLRVEEIVFQKDIIANLARWTKAIRGIGLLYVSVHLLLSFLIIMTITGMKIALRRDEIEIMKLIGADNSYIRTPFILEGMIYGFFGSLLAAVVFLLLVFGFNSQINYFLSDLKISLFEPTIIFLYFAVITSFGLVWGWFSSLISVFRFLK